MYSNEINDYLRSRGFSITYEQLEDLREGSPQVNRIRLLEIGAVSSRCQIGTSDGFGWDVWVGNKDD